MTFKSKEVTENIPPLSFAEGTEALAQPSKPSAEPTDKANSIPSMPTSRTPSGSMLSNGKPVSEKSRQHAVLAKVVLSNLEAAGLIRRFEVLSKDGDWMETQVVFDNTLWERSLVLSEGLTTPRTGVVNE